VRNGRRNSKREVSTPAARIKWDRETNIIITYHKDKN
jgi:hypothetical protein